MQQSSGAKSVFLCQSLHPVCVKGIKAVGRLCGYAGLSDHLLLTDALSTRISYYSSNNRILTKKSAHTYNRQESLIIELIFCRTDYIPISVGKVLLMSARDKI